MIKMWRGRRSRSPPTRKFRSAISRSRSPTTTETRSPPSRFLRKCSFPARHARTRMPLRTHQPQPLHSTALDGLPHMSCLEYDYVRIGADYLKVEAPAHASGTWSTRAITWADQVSVNNANTHSTVHEFRSSKTHIRSFQAVTAASTGGRADEPDCHILKAPRVPPRCESRNSSSTPRPSRTTASRAALSRPSNALESSRGQFAIWVMWQMSGM